MGQAQAHTNETIHTVWCPTESAFEHEWKRAIAELRRQRLQVPAACFRFHCGYCSFTTHRYYDPVELAEIMQPARKIPAFSNDGIAPPFHTHIRTTCPFAMREFVGRTTWHAVDERLRAHSLASRLVPQLQQELEQLQQELEQLQQGLGRLSLELSSNKQRELQQKQQEQQAQLDRKREQLEWLRQLSITAEIFDQLVRMYDRDDKVSTGSTKTGTVAAVAAASSSPAAADPSRRRKRSADTTADHLGESRPPTSAAVSAAPAAAAASSSSSTAAAATGSMLSADSTSAPLLYVGEGSTINTWQRLYCDAAFFQASAPELVQECRDRAEERLWKREQRQQQRKQQQWQQRQQQQQPQELSQQQQLQQQQQRQREKQRAADIATASPSSSASDAPTPAAAAAAAAAAGSAAATPAVSIPPSLGARLEVVPLRSLILSGSVTEQVLQLVGELVRLPLCHLEHLGLSHDRFGLPKQGRGLSAPLDSSVAPRVAAILDAPYAPLHVDLEGNKFTNADVINHFAPAIGRSRRLESIAWAGNPIGGRKVLEQLTCALQDKSKLERKFGSFWREIRFLSLGSPSVRYDDDPDGLALRSLLRKCDLSHLELSYMAIGTSAWGAIWYAVSLSLHQLVLREVGLTDGQVGVLADLLQQGVSINVLDLRNNRIHCEGAKALALALQEGAVSCCNLTCNPIGDQGRRALACAIEDGLFQHHPTSKSTAAARAQCERAPNHRRFCLLCLRSSGQSYLNADNIADGITDPDASLQAAAREQGLCFTLKLHVLPTRSRQQDELWQRYRWVPDNQLIESGVADDVRAARHARRNQAG